MGSYYLILEIYIIAHSSYLQNLMFQKNIYLISLFIKSYLKQLVIITSRASQLLEARAYYRTPR